MVMPFSDAKACVFDAYGTLFNIAFTPPHEQADPDDARLRNLIAAWRQRQVSNSWWHGLSGYHTDFWTITVDALEDAMESQGIDDDTLRNSLLAAFRTPRIYPDVGTALAKVKEMGLPAVLLSNGTPDMLNDATGASGIGQWLDMVLSVEGTGVFKPHPRVYQLAVDRLGLPREAIVFVSSNTWDVHAASLFGFRAVWCNRLGKRPERFPGRPEAVIPSLLALPPLLARKAVLP